MKELLTEFFASILNINETALDLAEKKASARDKVLQRKIKYKQQDGSEGEATIGALLKYDKEHPGFKAAKSALDSAKQDSAAKRAGTTPTRKPAEKKPSKKRPSVGAEKKGSRGKKETAAGATEYDPPVTTRSGRKISAVVPMGQHTPPHEKVSNDLPDRSDAEAKQYSRTTLSETNDEYYKRMRKQGGKSAVRANPVSFPKKVRETLRASGVPEHHIQMLERAANTTRISDNEPSMSDVVGGPVGAGKTRSQVGEVLALTLMAVQPKTERDKVAKAIRDAVGGDKNTLIDASWLEAGLHQADAFTAMMDNQHGEGNWQIEATAWDTPGDISGIGLTQKNKGFSTDVALRVRVKGQSKSQAVRLSLKKDGKIFLLNGTTNDMVTFAIQALSPKERQEAVTISRALETLGSRESTDEEKKQAMSQLRTVLKLDASTSDTKVKELAKQRRGQLTDKAVESLDSAARASVQTIREFPSRQQQSARKLGSEITKARPMTAAQEKAAMDAWNKRRKAVNPSAQLVSPEDKKFALAAHKAISALNCGDSCTDEDIRQALMKAGLMPQSNDPTANLDRFRKAVVFAAELEAYRNESVTKKLKAHKNIAVQAANAAIEATVRDPHLKAGMMLKLQETFPIQVIASGEETMCLGGVPINKATLESMFGTSDPKEIQEGLVVEEDPETGEKILVFIAGGKPPKGRRVAIANVKARQKGIGYDNGIGLEFEARTDFECAAAIANTKTNPPMNPESNQEIVAKCEKRTARAQSGKPKKKR